VLVPPISGATLQETAHDPDGGRAEERATGRLRARMLLDAPPPRFENPAMQTLRPAGLGGAILGLVLLLGGTSRGAPDLVAVEVLALDREPLLGAFVGVSAEALTVRPGKDGAGAVVTLPLASVRDLNFRAEVPAPAAQDRLRVTLASGEELVADAWGPAPDGLSLRSPSFGEVRVPLEAVRWLVPLPAKVGPCHDPAMRLPPRGGADVVKLVGGDEVQGTVAEVTPQGLVVELERGRKRTVAWIDLLVASLNNPDLPAPDRAFAEVETHAGDLLQAAAPLTGDAAKGLDLTLRADKSLAMHVPSAAVRAVRWRGGRCVDATTLPRIDTYRPFYDPVPGSLGDGFEQRVRGARVGRRPGGCPLRLDGTVYRHGLAVHSRTETRITLGGGFKTFQTLFGIDDEAREEGAGYGGVLGDVDARVLGDGKVLWEATGVTGAERARTVGPLAVAGVKELVLLVDYGGHYVTFDRATWADPLLLR
jgi:hypothetical protein